MVVSSAQKHILVNVAIMQQCPVRLMLRGSNQTAVYYYCSTEQTSIAASLVGYGIPKSKVAYLDLVWRLQIKH